MRGCHDVLCLQFVNGSKPFVGEGFRCCKGTRLGACMSTFRFEVHGGSVPVPLHPAPFRCAWAVRGSIKMGDRRFIPTRPPPGRTRCGIHRPACLVGGPVHPGYPLHGRTGVVLERSRTGSAARIVAGRQHGRGAPGHRRRRVYRLGGGPNRFASWPALVNGGAWVSLSILVVSRSMRSCTTRGHCRGRRPAPAEEGPVRLRVHGQFPTLGPGRPFWSP